MRTPRACPGHCAMHHECACADKLARHPAAGVANTPGTSISPRIEPGIDLRFAIRALLEQDVSSLPQVRALMADRKR